MLEAEGASERTGGSAKGMRGREKGTLGRGTWHGWRTWGTAGSLVGLGPGSVGSGRTRCHPEEEEPDPEGTEGL